MEMIGSSFAPHPLPIAAASLKGMTAHVPEIAVADDERLSFNDVLDIVNPLQHLPVVGTLYRAITHDTIKTPEKIIGDTIFGGVMGFVSSVADVAFERITGKSFGDTVLSFFIGSDEATGTEVAKAPSPGPAATLASAETPAAPEQALAQSLATRGIDPELQQRALFAYRRATAAFAN